MTTTSQPNTVATGLDQLRCRLRSFSWRPAPVSVSVTIDATRETVFDHLIDPRTYPWWLAGAQHIREVDDAWPSVGSRFHHRIGLGPLHLDDATSVVALDRPDGLDLRASIGSFGTAAVRFRLTGTRPTVLSIEEVPIDGPVGFFAATLGRLAVPLSLWARNRVSLDRLRDLIETGSLPTEPVHPAEVG